MGGEISPLRMCRSVSAAGVRNTNDALLRMCRSVSAAGARNTNDALLLMNAARWLCFVRLAPLPLPSAPPHSYYSFADIINE